MSPASQIFIEVSKVERGTFTATLTGMTGDIRPWWKRKLGRFALWLARVCGESQYVIDNRIPVDYEISADGEVKINLSGTSNETTMTMTGIPEHLSPKAPE